MLAPMVPGWIRIGAERHLVFQSTDGTVADDAAREQPAVLAFGFPTADATPAFLEKLGGDSLGPVPLLVRPLRLAYAAERLKLPRVVRALVPNLPLVAPFGGRRRAAVREIAIHDPRLTRLWERFCIDVGISVERNASFITRRIFDRPERGYRVLIVEDGDRYAIRAMCIFVIKEEESGRIGYVMELLHDRSVDGMRAASHLLGLAVREASDAGASAMHAWSLTQSGSFPIYALHAFVPVPERLRPSRSEARHFCVRALDPAVEDIATNRERWYLSYLDDDAI
jgi:hypothetical protein